ncbi:hypothetical protein A3Q56_02274 [Intoshia linei]|uniref:U1 small nuclear ribonucleoprotein 70 kDa n=1 Tax=Intoshia linei TaxID=1819745 RepID=A0A177B8L7_9BILA|nr:hypothetical protein A3Q56_02274 [Intoshia linei]
MTAYLPPNLLQLFAPDNPIPYLTPSHLLPSEKRPVFYNGVSQLLSNFEDPADTPPAKPFETRKQRNSRIKKERMKKHADDLEKAALMWNPKEMSNASKDPYKTLFVARLSYKLKESDIKHEFEAYGKIKRIRLIKTLENKPRGYCFIEYERERDMKNAYKRADGKKINGRRILVDYERGRTVKGWRPRRLGGGLGGESRISRTKKGRSVSMDSDRDSYRRNKSPKRNRENKSRSRSRHRHRRN